ncbi:MAG: protein jag [Dehalococcoidia bacterium]|nr:protein jag [Dehalococcoidia bacterium]
MKEEQIEVSATTVEQAIEKAEEQLGVSRDQFEVTVIREANSEIIGTGNEETVIKVELLATQENNTQVAIETLETLLRLMEIPSTVEVSGNEARISLDIEGDDLGILIGKHGQTLDCLQYIVRLIVSQRVKTWVPLNIDVCGYRKRRYDSLDEMAWRLAEQVKIRKHSIILDPMPPAERRIIHLALTDHPDVITHSTGEGMDRRVVISFRRS